MEKKSDNNGEIDLVTIFNGIKQLFLSLWSFCMNILEIVLRRWLIFLLFSGMGAGAGYALFLNTKPVYSASLTLSSKILTNDFCAGILENLGGIVKDRSPALLARKLNIDSTTASGITKIEFSNYNEKLDKMYEDRDTVVLGIPFKVIVHTYSNSLFEKIEPALIRFLENNEYATKRKEIKKQNLEAMRNKLSGEMVQLDSLKKNISEHILPRGTNSGFVFGQPIDPIGVYKAGIDMFRNDLNLREEIQLIDGIQVIESFSPREKPESPRLLRLLATGIALFSLIALLIAYRLEKK